MIVMIDEASGEPTLGEPPGSLGAEDDRGSAGRVGIEAGGCRDGDRAPDGLGDLAAGIR